MSFLIRLLHILQVLFIGLSVFGAVAIFLHLIGGGPPSSLRLTTVVATAACFVTGYVLHQMKTVAERRHEEEVGG